MVYGVSGRDVVRGVTGRVADGLGRAADGLGRAALWRCAVR
jgi:hypothetical protein